MNITRFLFLFFFLLLSFSSKATDYFVALDGNNKNAGTSIKAPFASIQFAIDQMVAGDVCFVRGGDYHEKIDLNGKQGTVEKPLTLTNYKGEEVVLDGTERIESPWVLDKGAIYKTELKKDITQLFVGDKLMTLARFPNALAFSETVWRRTGARCKKGAGSFNDKPKHLGHIVDDSPNGKKIAEAGISFNGCIALMQFGAHATGTRIVKNHTKGSNTFEYSPELFKYKTTHNYFFEGGVGDAERAMLDMPQEWAYDELTKTLYLWGEDGNAPSQKEVRGKTLTYAIEGDHDTRHIVIDGINFRATSFSFKSSDHISIKNCNLSYYTCSKRALGVLGSSETAQFAGTKSDFCENITIYNCTFKYADGNALSGDFVEDLLIENNLFYMIDYACANNDMGVDRKEGFDPSSSINLDRVRNLTYRRNTLNTSGNAQSFSANMSLEARYGKRFRPNEHKAENIPATVCEYNFHTRCGLLHTDGTSMYMPHSAVIESVAHHNWFINNGQRDLRYDGNNKPLQGVHANAFRNVCVSSNRRHSPSNGDGMHIKGDYHEIYNNLAMDAKSDLNIDLGSGGNAHTITKNNVAQEFLDKPIPGTASNNYAGGKSKKRVSEMIRDASNWDFRPKADAKELIDQGEVVSCTSKGKTIEVTPAFLGKAPDIGAYEYGDKVYWIPGRLKLKASMPIPKNKGVNVPLDAEIMYLAGLGAKKATIYFGEDSNELKKIDSKTLPYNIVSLKNQKLQKGKTYYWRADLTLEDNTTVKGDLWSFTTVAQ